MKFLIPVTQLNSPLGGLYYIFPEILIAIAICTNLIWAFLATRNEGDNRRNLYYFNATALMMALLWILMLAGRGSGGGRMVLFFNCFNADILSHFMKILLLGSTFILFTLIEDYHQRAKIPHVVEYFTLLLCALLGAMFMVSGNDFILIYLGLELLSIASYVLVAFDKNRELSTEAGIKYLLFGAATSGITLYGFSLLYILTRSLNLDQIQSYLLHHPADPKFMFLTAALVLASLAFKIGVVPFHQWVPDVYQGSPTPTTAFLAVTSKLAGFGLLIRIMAVLFGGLQFHWSLLFYAMAMFSMVIGNFAALQQTDIKRMIAYSGIAQGGYILAGFVAILSPLALDANLALKVAPLEPTLMAITGVVYYLFAYMVMELGAFVAIIHISNQIDSDNIVDYAGVARLSPGYALFLTLCLLSLGGIPPLVGFFGKFMVFGALLKAAAFNTALLTANTLLVAVGLLTSVVSFGYYFNVVRVMYLEAPKVERRFDEPFMGRWTFAILCFGIFLFGVYPQPVYHIGTLISRSLFTIY